MSEATIKFGMYDGYTLDLIPLDYLLWLLPRLNDVEYDRQGAPGKAKKGSSLVLYGQILDYFFRKGIRVEDRTKEGKGHCFYLNDYEKLTPENEVLPFAVSKWKGKDSEGNPVYEIESPGGTSFIVKEGNRYHLSTKYVSHRYPFGGQTMVYEKNPNYWFRDGYGRIVQGAYLMRKPYVPTKKMERNFSKNNIKELQTNEPQ